MSGDTAVIGAPDDDHGGIGSGSAYVFTRSGSTWTEQAKLTASDAAAERQFRHFGFGIGRYRGGRSAGGRRWRHPSGSAYVFTRSGSTWTEQAKLTASDAAGGDQFGYSVSVIGRYRGDRSAARRRLGQALRLGLCLYSLWRCWTEQAKLTASDAAAEDFFGGSVSVSGDTAVIGA